MSREEMDLLRELVRDGFSRVEGRFDHLEGRLDEQDTQIGFLRQGYFRGPGKLSPSLASGPPSIDSSVIRQQGLVIALGLLVITALLKIGEVAAGFLWTHWPKG